VLDPRKSFQSSLIFAGKARILSLMGLTHPCFEFMQVLSLPKSLVLTNALAYLSQNIIVEVKVLCH
jgi:hypothetical protein